MLSFASICLLAICTALALLYRYVNHKYSYWSSRGISGPRPIFPFGFTLDKAYTRPDEYELGNFRRFGPIYGLYTGTLPTLTIADPALVRQVLVTDFTSYANRRELNSYNHIWNKNMANLEGDEWRRVRSILTPAFSSGKLRAMYPLMDRCVSNLINFVNSKIEDKSSGLINAKDALSGFAIDVIASTAFATETDANNSSSKSSGNGSGSNKSDFVHYGTTIFSVPPVKTIAVMTFPRFLLRLFGITVFFSEASFRFMIALSQKIIHDRKAKLSAQNGSKIGKKAADFVQLMMDSSTTDEELKSVDLQSLAASIEHESDGEKEEEKVKSKPEAKIALLNPLKKSGSPKRMLDEDEIVGQCVLFFFAGFETSAFQGTVALFELAHHPEMQDRLFAEVSPIVTNHRTGNSTEPEYIEALMSHAPYLEAVVKECLRKYPNVVRLERRVSAPEGTTLAGIHLDPGTLVEVPTFALHHNPEFYPEPEVFRPERFLPENKHLLVPYTFLPFGDGPRNCVGMRFAYQEIKLALARLVVDFRFSLAADTPSKLTFAPGAQLLVCEPFHLKVEKRI